MASDLFIERLPIIQILIRPRCGCNIKFFLPILSVCITIYMYHIMKLLENETTMKEQYRQSQ